MVIKLSISLTLGEMLNPGSSQDIQWNHVDSHVHVTVPAQRATALGSKGLTYAF